MKKRDRNGIKKRQFADIEVFVYFTLTVHASLEASKCYIVVSRFFKIDRCYNCKKRGPYMRADI